MMQNEHIEEIRTDFFSKYPQFELKDFLGEGRHGFAFAISENKALKFTGDDREIEVCRCLEGHKFTYLCNIEKVGDKVELNVSWNNRSKEYTWIVLERLKQLDQKWIHQTLRNFRHAWSSLFPEDQNLSRFNLTDIWTIYSNDDKSKIDRCKELIKDYIKNINSIEEPSEEILDDQIKERIYHVYRFFDFIENAYRELFKVCSFGEIDLNDGNFMLDKNNNLKVIDLQKVNL